MPKEKYEIHKKILWDIDQEYFDSTVGNLCSECMSIGRKAYMRDVDRIII